MKANDLLIKITNETRARRMDLKVKQSQLAAMTGIALPTIRTFEAGKGIKLEYFLRIRIALGFYPSEKNI